MAAAATEEERDIYDMSEVELRQWVEANPGRVNEGDSEGLTPLAAIASKEEGLALVVWLLDEKGADVNATMANRVSALHYAKTLDILNALLDRGGIPPAETSGVAPLLYTRCTKVTPIKWHACCKTRVSGPPLICKTMKAKQLFITPASSPE